MADTLLKAKSSENYRRVSVVRLDDIMSFQLVY